MQCAWKAWVLCCLLAAAVWPLAAQEFVPQSSLRRKWISTASDSLRLDSLSLAWGSLAIAGVPDSAYTVSYPGAILYWRRRPAADSVWVRYRVLAIDFNKVYSHKSPALIDSNILFPIYSQADETRASNSFQTGKLTYSGSYGRSVSLGNNQDVVLNSAFNFQADGYILDSIRLQAALTDNTIPFQPEGATQRLQEFDQIMIRLQKNKHALKAGDYNLDPPPGYFLKFFKRVQGLYYQYNTPVADALQAAPSTASSFEATPPSGNQGFGVPRRQSAHPPNRAMGLSASMTKGQFARNIFQGTEGNQGPYRLSGSNGEQYLVILAATERVYVDQVLQERGERADYIINYNTAEIRFMPRRMITKDSRIQVEFEYVDRNYLNSLFYTWGEASLGKRWRIRAQGYSNQDARNQPYLQNLTPAQKQFLAAIGDSVQQAYYPNIATDTLGAGKILYRMTDTLVNGRRYDSVFVYATDRETARYLPAFAFIGSGRGDYVLSDRAANGRVYDWVAPINGQKQGNYAPVQLLIAPKKHQLVQVMTRYDADSNTQLQAEWAASNYDPNLFSTRDNQRHWGAAARIQFAHERTLRARQRPSRSPIRLGLGASYEFVQDRFQAIAPFRSVEFGRDWNVPLQSGLANEHLADVALSLKRGAVSMAYTATYYARNQSYKGLRQIARYDRAGTRFQFGGVANALTATDSLRQIHFLRPSVYATYSLRRSGIILGARWEAEHNEVRLRGQSVLLPAAFSFDITTLTIKTNAVRSWQRSLSYFTRTDRAPVRDKFVPQNRSHNIELRTSVANWARQTIQFVGTYRRLVVRDTTVLRARGDESMLGRLEWSGGFWRDFLTASCVYEGGSGQEQKRIYTYVEVPVGQGNYTWNDYNSDGLQQANEFEQALYPDQRRFIRVLSPTNDFVRVNYLNASFSLAMEPAQLWRAEPRKGLARLVSRLSTMSSLQTNHRLMGAAAGRVLNPFLGPINQDAVLGTNSAASQNIYFNRNSAVWGLEYSLLHTASRQLLTYGLDGLESRQHIGRLRWNMRRTWVLQLSAQKGARRYQSPLNDGRSYQLAILLAEPSLSYLFKSVWRTTCSYRAERRQNGAALGGERSTAHSLTADTRYAQANSGVLAASLTYTHIEYIGNPKDPVAFIILEALQPGRNLLWRAVWERRLGKGMELQLQYEGRQPAGRSVIHSGTLSIRAIL